MLGLFASSAAIRGFGIALLLAGLFGGGYWRGHDAATTACEAARAKQLEEHLNELALETQRADQIAQAFADWRQSHGPRRVGYVRAASELRSCNPVPDSFVRLLNAASSGAGVSEDSTGTACAPSTIATDRVADITSENLAACVESNKQLNALIDILKGK
jgi:hypothetical protein